ncbi:hypothetical protein F4678DRAFT_244394 [Xylaria arbuscula]|nr:hypothetical protein F4678DRAFT_244394 [Xylaria arbuscula]
MSEALLYLFAILDCSCFQTLHCRYCGFSTWCMRTSLSMYYHVFIYASACSSRNVHPHSSVLGGLLLDCDIHTAN